MILFLEVYLCTVGFMSNEAYSTPTKVVAWINEAFLGINPIEILAEQIKSGEIFRTG